MNLIFNFCKSSLTFESVFAFVLAEKDSSIYNFSHSFPKSLASTFRGLKVIS